MAGSDVLFWLKPVQGNLEAIELVNDPANAAWVVRDRHGARSIEITLKNKSKTAGRLVSFGRPRGHCDILLPSKGFSRNEQCYFDVNQMSKAIMLHDVSPRQKTTLRIHDPSQREDSLVPPDELDNALSRRTCVVRAGVRYTFHMNDMEFLLIPGAMTTRRMESQLAAFIQQIPDDYNTITDKSGVTFSDGEIPGEHCTPENPRLDGKFAKIPHDRLKHIGAGGEAKVHKTLNLQNGNIYACKIISLMRDGKIRDKARALKIKHRVVAEVKAVRELQHENVISYHYTQGWHTTSSELLIFMPVYDTSLRRMMPIPMERKSGAWRTQVQKMISDIRSALEYIHSQGICHRDVKPGNILHQDGSFCLTDFGMAESYVDRIPMPFKRGHTRSYAAPETLTNEVESYKVDIFSFGVTVLECLHELPLPSSPQNAENSLAKHDDYRHRLRQAWPAAEPMLAHLPTGRPTASGLRALLLGGVPVPSNSNRGPRGLKRHERDDDDDNSDQMDWTAREIGSSLGVTQTFGDPMSWTAELPSRTVRPPAGGRSNPRPQPNPRMPPSLKDRTARVTRAQTARRAKANAARVEAREGQEEAPRQTGRRTRQRR